MNDETADDERNSTFYQTLLARHGDSHQSLNWGSAQSQQQRFKVLAEVGIDAGESVLDVGCGLGDFYGWLQNHYPGVHYTGIDLTPAMIERAKERFPEVQFFEGTILELSTLVEERFDHIMASGIFYLRQHDPDKYFQRTVRTMFDHAQKSIAVNTLSAWAQTKVGGEFYADPLRALDFCHSLTSRVVLRHDYHPTDFTVYLYKESIKV